MEEEEGADEAEEEEGADEAEEEEEGGERLSLSLLASRA